MGEAHRKAARDGSLEAKIGLWGNGGLVSMGWHSSLLPWGLLTRNHAHQLAVGTIGQEVKLTVGTLADGADALPDVSEQRFLGDDVVAIQDQSADLAEFECADEEIAAPCWVLVAGVEGHAAWCDRGVPIVVGLLHAWCGAADADLLAGIVRAVADDGPAVVLPASMMFNSSPPRAPCSTTQSLPVAGLNGSGLGVAVTVAPDLGLGILAADEGIVGRHGTVRIDAHDFAEMFAEILCRCLHIALAKGDEELAVRREDQPGTEVISTASRQAACGK